MGFSPLDQFDVYSLLTISAPIINFGVSLTNLGIYAIFGVILLLGVFVLSSTTGTGLNSSLSLVPTRWSVGTESAFASLQGLANGQLSDGYEEYLPFIISLFGFILITNLMSNVPYNFAVATSAVISMGLSLTVFIGVTLLALNRHKIKWFSFFVPAGTPLILVPVLVLIETLSYLARAVSLGVRLFANLVAGHVLLSALSGMIWPIFTGGILLGFVSLIPLAIFTALVGLEIAVSFIQAYVFTVLTSSYIADALHLH